MARWLAVAAMGVAVAAQAGLPLNVPEVVRAPVGWTTAVELNVPVAQVSVERPELVTVKIEGNKVFLHGRTAGVTEATLRTSNGTVTFRVYVASSVKDEKDRVYWWTP